MRIIKIFEESVDLVHAVTINIHIIRMYEFVFKT